MKFSIPEVLNEKMSLEYWVDQYGSTMGAIAHRLADHIELRTRLAEAQNWKCCWCGNHMTAVRNKRNSTTTEHVIPKSKGGADHEDNFAVACVRCNNKRGDRDVEEYLQLVAEKKKE